MLTKSKVSANRSLGNLTNWSTETNGITGVTTSGKFKVEFYNEGTVRICVTQNETFDDFSYAVVAKPSATPAIKETPTELQLTTSTLTLRVSKEPVRFYFYTPDGACINEDDAAFGTSWNGEQVTTYKKLQEGERFIGLGEKTGPLDRKGNGYQNWNTDAFAYGTSSDPLYSSIPFYMGIHHGLCYGIFFDNTFKSFFNFGASNNRFASFYADGGDMNYYFMYGKNIGEVIKNYTALTGRMEMPPLWSIGYQQCRYSYYPDTEVISLAKTFREKDIPADTIVFDIHYMDQYKIFTWNKRDFSDPQLLLQQLREMGFHVVVMCDPGIKVEAGYSAYDDGIDKQVFIKYPDGTNYTGQVWPGWCHFPDFTNPETRAWWQEHLKGYVDFGIEGYWNDMNEIATWGQMLPENIELDFDGHGATMRKARNVYGFQMARSTYEGAKALMKGKRPFNLTRSGYAGVQRYSAVWTGDNVAYDDHMLLGVRLVNSMGLSGIAFAGYDVGGFVGDASPKLFARWVSIGAFSPFFRGHSMINSRDSEPWAFGEEVEQISRNYIKFRYQLLPYIYSLFFDAVKTGMPVQRSLAIDYMNDHRIYDGQFHNQYLFGPAFLVAPVDSNKEFVKVYLPEGEWYSLYNGQHFHGHQEMIVECPVHRLPVYVKGSSIIPMRSSASHSKQKTDSLVIHLYGGAANNSFLYYEDDGNTFAYQQGDYVKRLLTYTAQQNNFTIGRAEGKYVSPLKTVKVVLHGFTLQSNTLTINGKAVNWGFESNQFFAPLEKFDPFYDPEPAPQEQVRTVTIPWSTAEISLMWS